MPGGHCDAEPETFFLSLYRNTTKLAAKLQWWIYHNNMKQALLKSGFVGKKLPVWFIITLNLFSTHSTLKFRFFIVHSFTAVNWFSQSLLKLLSMLRFGNTPLFVDSCSSHRPAAPANWFSCLFICSFEGGGNLKLTRVSTEELRRSTDSKTGKRQVTVL